MTVLIEWDYKEQPDWTAINRALVEVYDGTHCPTAVPVPDTRSDQYVVVVASRPFTEQDAQRVYDGTSGACRFGEHDECTSEDCICSCHRRAGDEGSRE